MSRLFKGTMIVLLVLTIVFTAFDLGVSNQLYNPSSRFAIWMGAFSYVPTYFIVVVALMIMTRFLMLRFVKYRIPLFLLGMLGAGILFTIFGLKLYDYVVNPWLTILAVSFLMLVSSLGIAWDIAKERVGSAARISAVVLTSYALILGVVMGIKPLWGRARYYGILHEEGEFSLWFIPQGLATSNVFQAFPSGHVAFAAFLIVLVLVPLVYLEKRTWLYPTFALVGIWMVLTALSRIMTGSHFVTDTTVSALLAVAIVYFSRPLAEKLLDYVIKKSEPYANH